MHLICKTILITIHDGFDERNFNIVVVEDNLADFRLMELAFAEKKILNRVKITHLKDGEEAIDYFKNFTNYDNKIDLVLLDLHIPKYNGFEVLEILKENLLLSETKVYILSNSSNQEDIQFSFKLKASGYIQKPINIEDFFEIVDVIIEVLDKKSTYSNINNKLLHTGQLILN